MSRINWVRFTSNPSFGRPYYTYLSPNSFPSHHPQFCSFRSTTVLVLKTPSSESERVEDNVLQEFFRDRQANGDLITKYSDIIFQRGLMRSDDLEASEVTNSSQPVEEALADEPEGGFLKLKTTQEWLLGETSAPLNRKSTSKEVEDTRDKRRRLSLLQYEALKRELFFMTVGGGAACTGYCLLTLSIQAALSYASGVGLSCLYLQLLYQHVDNMPRDSIPLIFRQRKPKKIGIRSEDLQDFVERSVKGSGIALSSPRLVIPAAIYGLWIVLDRNLNGNLFDFQIVPAMMGLFAYKAAALIQVYRDNEDLQLIFPDDEL